MPVPKVGSSWPGATVGSRTWFISEAVALIWTSNVTDWPAGTVTLVPPGSENETPGSLLRRSKARS